MARSSTPDLILVGQVTIDDVVPATPGPWHRQLGGSVLYALAGALQCLPGARIGIVTRTGQGFPFALDALLDRLGVIHRVSHPIAFPHLVEWLIYEPDASRRSLPRNPELLGFGGEGASESREAYLERLQLIAPRAAEIPPAWLPAAAVHLCPQVGNRHVESITHLRDKVDWISVDPSPHYSRGLDATALTARLAGISAYLPSQQELGQHHTLSEEAVIAALYAGGFPEVVLKRGARGALLAASGSLQVIPATPVEAVDPTGAGDAFCGAYAACRLAGDAPHAAATRAVRAAARVVGCRGVESALLLR